MVIDKFNIDLDRNGTVDFVLDDIDVRFRQSFSLGLIARGGGIRMRTRPGVNLNIVAQEALALPAGAAIAVDGQQYHSAFLAMNYRAFSDSSDACSPSCYGYVGQFRLTPRAYLGLIFSLPDGRHAAWADVEWRGLVEPARIYSYAYETAPETTIVAGDKGPPINLPGDTNADFQVDIVDLNNVRNNFGATGDGVLGDANGDDVVDIQDLNAVRNNFGAGNPVPEPPSLALLAAGAAGLAVLRRNRARHKLC